MTDFHGNPSGDNDRLEISAFVFGGGLIARVGLTRDRFLAAALPAAVNVWGPM